MLKIEFKGDFKVTKKRLKKASVADIDKIFDKYGKKGVEALRNATPKKTGLTASSWYYSKDHKDGISTLSFNNSNIQNGVLVAIIIQYGHATKSGTYVSGIDYINPALKPIFEQMSQEIKREGGIIK